MQRRSFNKGKLMEGPATQALYEKIYLVVEQVPAGMVATYGDIATVVGGGCDGRAVGQALGVLPRERAASVPWQRVINREGGISTSGLRQRELLEAEAVAFDEQGRAILARHRWRGPTAEWAAAHKCHPLPAREEGEQLSLF
jgi:methylated-DNA-protein-cysteine methyltransferase-like protein